MAAILETELGSILLLTMGRYCYIIVPNIMHKIWYCFCLLCALNKRKGMRRMKKLSCRVLAAALSLLIASGCAFTAFAAEGRYGDVNADSKINSTDALCVLKHAVGSQYLEGDVLFWADVNADTKINSSDALEILQHSVGKIDKFSAEIADSDTKTEEEILKIFSSAISKAHEDIPSYKYVNSSKTTDVKLLGNLASSLTDEQEASLKEQMGQTQTYRNVFSKGTANAYNNLPRECTVTDPSKFESVAYEVLESGNYKITIDLKDEANPNTGSMIVNLLGLPDYNSVKETLEKEFESVVSALGPTVSLDVNNIKYSNCSVTCVVNPENGELVSYDITSDTIVGVEFTMLLVSKLNIDMTTQTTVSYSNFTY